MKTSLLILITSLTLSFIISPYDPTKAFTIILAAPSVIAAILICVELWVTYQEKQEATQ